MAKVLFFATPATDDTTKATLALIGAVGAKTGGIECAVSLVGEGAALIRDTIANNIHGVGFPPFKELMAKVVEAKVPIYV